MEWKYLIDEAWDPQYAKLKVRLSETMSNLRERIEVEEAKQEQGQVGQVARKLQGFGDSLLDSGSFANLISHKKTLGKLDEQSFARLRKLETELAHWQKNLAEMMPSCHFQVSQDEGVEVIAQAHLQKAARLFALLRMAGLERQNRYEPKVHDPFFADFTWEHLTNEELSTCPPFVVTLTDQGEGDLYFRKIMPWLTCGLPIKILLLRHSFHIRS